MTQDLTTRRSWLPAVAGLLAMVLTAGLGVWQLQRGAQKQTLADSMRARAAMPPLSQLPPTGQADVADLFHRLVSARGTWMSEHTVYLDNRQIVVNGRARVGYDVVTPLLLDDGSAVIVQRGWVPRDFIDRSRLPPVSTPSGSVTVQGRYASAPPRLYEFKGATASTGTLRQNLDVKVYAVEVGRALRPGSIIQIADEITSEPMSTVAGTTEQPKTVSTVRLERVWTLPDSGVARHHGYAFQWFALSALLAGLLAWFHFIQPRRRPR